MTLRLDMMAAASRAAGLLGPRAAAVAGFLGRCLNADGGFAGRDGRSDLYYTIFGLEGLLALGAAVPVDAIGGYLRSFPSPEADLIEISCLARSLANLSLAGAGAVEEPLRLRLLQGVAEHRAADGAYAQFTQAPVGNVYGCFLAVGAFEDLGGELPDPAPLVQCANGCRGPQGGYAIMPGIPAMTTPNTAAAVMLLQELRQGPDLQAGRWLLERACPDGGFLASPVSPAPDLLSTAVALHAIRSLHLPLDGVRDSCLRFIDSLWSPEGGFRGNQADDLIDCEYTCYGLLALGCLA